MDCIKESDVFDEDDGLMMAYPAPICDRCGHELKNTWQREQEGRPRPDIPADTSMARMIATKAQEAVAKKRKSSRRR
jgi:hypothetical protein